MKHCQKSDTEPSGLAEYRANTPDTSWEEFKVNNPDAYNEVVRQLVEDQQSLCAFCELALDEDNIQVAHYHPKSDRTGGVNWAFVWSNLWLCCKGGTQTWHQSLENYTPPLPQNMSCDEKKGSRVLDGDILRPDCVPAFPRIFCYVQYPNAVDIQTDIHNCEKAQMNTKIIDDTIGTVNLNCLRLSSARLTVLRMIEKDIETARRAGVKDLSTSHIPAKWLSKTSKGRYRKFFTLARWRLRDSGEQFLEGVGYEG